MANGQRYSMSHLLDDFFFKIYITHEFHADATIVYQDDKNAFYTFKYFFFFFIDNFPTLSITNENNKITLYKQ